MEARVSLKYLAIGCSYKKMIALWGFSVFVTGFTRTEKICVKVIDDDIYSRIIKFKAKNKRIKMYRNYSNVDNKIW